MSFTTSHAQVGINTKNPLATLEVHRSSLSNVPDGIIPPRISADSLQLKDHLYGPAQNGAMIYVTKPATKNTGRTSQMTSSGYYIFDASYSNQNKTAGSWKKMFNDPHAFASRSISSVSFVTSDGSRNNFQSIKFDDSFDTQIGSEYLDGNQYIVPESGLYVINYNIITDKSAVVETLEIPSIVIMRSLSDIESSVLSAKTFDAFSTENGKVNLANLSPQATINHIYNLKKGEKLSFGLKVASGNVANFGKVSSEISIYKIR